MSALDLSHPLSPLTGRRPDEPHRAASNLELLYDLTFAVAFSTAGGKFAHLIAHGDVVRALLGFGLTIFSVIWAWINFSWFASAYDTDDWLYRALVMVQMAGVVIMAIGFRPLFASIADGGLDGVLATPTSVAGYIVMRAALLVQWARAWRGDAAHRGAIAGSMACLVVAQAMWTLTAVFPLTLRGALWVGPLIIAVELLGPWLVARRWGATPWHPHHIGERYGLLAIITLGEGIIGATAALSSAVEATGWSVETVLTITAGLALTCGLWWSYFVVDFGDVLALCRNRAFFFGYAHLPLFAGLAATGAGLHVAGSVIEGEGHVEAPMAVLAVAMPVLVVMLMIYVLILRLIGGWNAFHALLVTLTVAVLAAAVGLAHLRVGMGWCLLVVAAAPFITVVGFELVGHRHVEEQLRQLEAHATQD